HNLIQIQEEMGWTLLRNEHRILERNGDQMAVLGVENWSDKPQFPKYGDLKKTWEAAKDTPFKILLSHDPSHWGAEVLHYPDIALSLACHTPEMQISIEIAGTKWSPAQLVYRRRAGLYQEGKQSLYVNRGLGFLGYAGRLGIMPEITVIHIS